MKNHFSARYMINGFKYPKADTIKHRSSTICRSMACTLVTREACTPEIEQTWLRFFNDKCAYCGAVATHLDHLYPLVHDREPTGYGTGPSNLVPCCGKCNQAKGNMLWEEFMRSNRCQHVVGIDGDREAAMCARINKIKEFQEAMPARKNTIGDEAKKKWCEILNQFTIALKKAEGELLELMKLRDNIGNGDCLDCVYAIAQDPWVGINDCQRPYDWRKYPSLFRKEVFKKESDAISALIKEVSLEVSRNRITAHDDFDLEFGDNAVKIVWKQKAVGCGEGDAKVAYLRIEKIEVPARYKVVEDRTMIADMADFLNKDIRFRFWDCHEWIRQFCHSMCAYRNGAVSQYSLEDLKVNCDWWKFIGVTYDGDYSFEQLDVPKLVDGCPWFMDHPECSQIHLGPKDWVLLLNRHPKFADRCKVWKEFSDEDWNGLIERHPQLVKYKNIGSGEGI